MGNAQAGGGGGGGGSTPPSTNAAHGALGDSLLDSSGAARNLPNGDGQSEENETVPKGNGQERVKPQEKEDPAVRSTEPSRPVTRLLPIPEDYMIEMLPTYANTALYGLTTFNFLVANTVAPAAQVGIVQSLLYMCPYTYIPLGVMSAVLGTVATKCRRFAGVASGFMLVQLLYVIALGGFTMIIRMQSTFTFKSENKDKDMACVVVMVFSSVLCFMVLAAWSILLPYPKCISLWNLIGPAKPQGAAAAMALSAEANEAAGVAYRAAKDAVAIAKVARSDAKLAKEAADDAIAAEGAVDRAVGAERDAAEAASKAKRAAQGATGYAIAAEKAADEATERCRRAQVASKNAEKSTQEAQAAEDKTRLLSDAGNKV